jgi:hypothetical protein
MNVTKLNLEEVFSFLNGYIVTVEDRMDKYFLCI